MFANIVRFSMTGRDLKVYECLDRIRALRSATGTRVGAVPAAATFGQGCVAQHHTHSAIGNFPVPDQRFDSIHIDLVGPLPSCNGNCYLLRCIDQFTRWPEAFPISDATASTVASALVSGWIARFGVPSSLVTDRGAEFELALWNSLMKLLGCKRKRTTAYHLQFNGLIERFHRHVKSSLRTLSDSNH